MSAGKVFCLLLWLGCLLHIPLHAQTLSSHKALGRFQQYVWQDQHGLPQNGVNTVIRTRDGYLWLGTFEGAARFDGVRFTVFDINNTPEFKIKQIMQLLEDRAGNLWINARGQLCRFRDGHFNVQPIENRHV